MKKVLIIEDNQWLAENYQHILAAHQLETKIAGDGWQAIELIDEFKPDVLLLDMMLPLQSGIALLHELQSHSDTSVLPVVVCSSLVLDETQQDQLKKYGTYEVLNKATLTPDVLIGSLTGAFRANT